MSARAREAGRRKLVPPCAGPRAANSLPRARRASLGWAASRTRHLFVARLRLVALSAAVRVLWVAVAGR